jgi:hypothetical protein
MRVSIVSVEKAGACPVFEPSFFMPMYPPAMVVGKTIIGMLK